MVLTIRYTVHDYFLPIVCTEICNTTDDNFKYWSSFIAVP